jgi:hypothetical protein
MSVSEQNLLDEIRNITKNYEAFGSRQQGKKFYDSQKLPSILESYIKSSKKTLPDIAKTFGMSRQSLLRIMEGRPLSENMLFRILNSIESVAERTDISLPKDERVYPGDWRNTNTAEIQTAISEVSQRLIFLKKVIETSSILNSPESPIDKIQIAQLTALLEATLAAIRAPCIETGQTGGFFKWLGKLGKHALEKGIENKVSEAIDGAVDAGKDLLRTLSDAAGSSDLGNMIT